MLVSAAIADPATLHLTVEQRGTAALITATGTLAAGTAGALVAAVASAVKEGAEQIVVDLVEIASVDSAGLRAILRLPDAGGHARVVVRSGAAVARTRQAAG